MKNKVLTYLLLCCMGLVLLSGCKKRNDDVSDTVATETVSAEATVESTEKTVETEEVEAEATAEIVTEETTEDATDETAETKVGNSGPEDKKPETVPSKEPEKKPEKEPSKEPEAHVHSYSAVSKAATCTEAGYTEEVCSCGDKRNHVDIPKGEHTYVEYWLYYPTCLGVGYHWYECGVCAHYDASRSGEVPPIEHSIEEKVVTEGNCSVNKQIDQICTMCQLKVGSREEPGDASKHDWVTSTFSRWDDEVFDMVSYEETYCSRCRVTKQ